MTRYQLTIEADKLKRVSSLRAGSPYAVVTVTGGSREGDVLGMTEALDTLTHLRWSTIVFIETDPSTYLPISVEIFDKQENGKDEKKMAVANFEVTSIYQSPVHTQCEELNGGTIVRATCIESVQGSLDQKSFATLQFRLLDVKNIESGILGLGRTDPFVEIQKKNVDPDVGIVQWITAHRTEHVMDNLNPVFKAFDLPVEALCYCNEEWPLRLVVWDWQRNGKHRTLGCYETSLKDMQYKEAKGGNADRSSALPISIEGAPTTLGLIIVLKAELNGDQ